MRLISGEEKPDLVAWDCSGTLFAASVTLPLCSAPRCGGELRRCEDSEMPSLGGALVKLNLLWIVMVSVLVIYGLRTQNVTTARAREKLSPRAVLVLNRGFRGLILGVACLVFVIEGVP